MRASLKIVLSLISLLVLLQACSLRYHPDYKATQAFATEGKDVVVEHFQKILFKTHVQAFGKEASGLLFIKQLGREQYRFVFMSQLGMKFFDVELNNGVFVVHHLVSFLDKKQVRRVLKNDLQLLIQKPELLNAHYFKSKNKSYLLLRDRGSKGRMYYTYHQNQIIAKEQAGCVFKNTTIQYQYKGVGLPSQISIKHEKFNLSWSLYPIKKQLQLEE